MFRLWNILPFGGVSRNTYELNLVWHQLGDISYRCVFTVCHSGCVIVKSINCCIWGNTVLTFEQVGSLSQAPVPWLYFPWNCQTPLKCLALFWGLWVLPSQSTLSLVWHVSEPQSHFLSGGVLAALYLIWWVDQISGDAVNLHLWNHLRASC